MGNTKGQWGTTDEITCISNTRLEALSAGRQAQPVQPYWWRHHSSTKKLWHRRILWLCGCKNHYRYNWSHGDNMALVNLLFKNIIKLLKSLGHPLTEMTGMRIARGRGSMSYLASVSPTAWNAAHTWCEGRARPFVFSTFVTLIENSYIWLSQAQSSSPAWPGRWVAPLREGKIANAMQM